MRVKVRALIVRDGKIAVHRETRQGRAHLALPGGRVNRWERARDALVRELREELDLDVEPERLLYVCEAVKEHRLQDLNLVFLARPHRDADLSRLELVNPREPGDRVLPPILDQIANDLEAGLPESPRWLGNIWREP